jgi:type IV secretory pathway protease TraF
MEQRRQQTVAQRALQVQMEMVQLQLPTVVARVEAQGGYLPEVLETLQELQPLHYQRAELAELMSPIVMAGLQDQPVDMVVEEVRAAAAAAAAADIAAVRAQVEAVTGAAEAAEVRIQ